MDIENYQLWSKIFRWNFDIKKELGCMQNREELKKNK